MLVEAPWGGQVVPRSRAYAAAALIKMKHRFVTHYNAALPGARRCSGDHALWLLLFQVLEWRIRHWTAAGRQVIVVGDLNISPAPIDSCDPHPITQFVQRPDRVWLNKLLGPEGPRVVDIFRHFHPNRCIAGSVSIIACNPGCVNFSKLWAWCLRVLYEFAVQHVLYLGANQTHNNTYVTLNAVLLYVA